MANTFLTPSIIANEALMVLKENLVMANLVHRDYSKEFVGVGDTITVRKPAKFVAKNFVGRIEEQDISEGKVDVKMDRFRDVSVNVTSKEMTLDIKNFSEQVITPAMRSIAVAVDADLIATGIQGAVATVTKGQDAAKPIKDIAKVGAYLDMFKAPANDRRLVLNPIHKVDYVTDDIMSNVAASGSSETLRNALLGHVYGMDTYMTQNAPYSAAGILGEAGTATEYKVTGTAGKSTVSLSEVKTATATVKKGDCFIIDGYIYHFAEDGKAASGAIENIALDQPIHKDFNAETATAITAPTSLGFHRNGIALVTRSLELPMGNKNSYIASADGLAVRVVFDYDSETKKDRISFDILYGIKTLDSDLLVKLQG